jgi:aspartyl-tRNA(Asn)/glutamyl-tRNA(Gln) amidotransferase subunit C
MAPFHGTDRTVIDRMVEAHGPSRYTLPARALWFGSTNKALLNQGHFHRMSLDHATVRRIASLARIRLEEHEVEGLRTELNGILGWIEQLNEVDVSGIEPLAGAAPMAAALRDDVITDGGYPDKVLSNAPDRAGNFYAVPKVVE